MAGGVHFNVPSAVIRWTINKCYRMVKFSDFHKVFVVHFES